MRTDRLRINQLSAKTYEWYLAYLQAVDTKNVEVYGTFLTDDCVMRSNNDPPVEVKLLFCWDFLIIGQLSLA